MQRIAHISDDSQIDAATRPVCASPVITSDQKIKDIFILSTGLPRAWLIFVMHALFSGIMITEINEHISRFDVLHNSASNTIRKSIALFLGTWSEG